MCSLTYQEKRIAYFSKPGPANTDKVLSMAKERCLELGLKHVVIASSFGDTALRALSYFEGSNMVVVSSRFGFRKPNEKSLSDTAFNRLTEAGSRIVFQTHLLGAIDRSIYGRFGGITPVRVIAETLRILGEGIKVCVEIAVMAADSGDIPTNNDVIAIAGSGRGADTAIVLIPANSNNFFDLHIKEIICMPRQPKRLTDPGLIRSGTLI